MGAYERIPRDDKIDEVTIWCARDDFIKRHTSGATSVVLNLFTAIDLIMDKNENDGADIGSEVIQPILDAIKLIEKYMLIPEGAINGNERPRVPGCVDSEESMVGHSPECVGEGHIGRD